MKRIILLLTNGFEPLEAAGFTDVFGWADIDGERFIRDVRDGNLITSTGPGTGVELAFELLADLTSAAHARHIRALMRIPEPGPAWGTTPQAAS